MLGMVCEICKSVKELPRRNTKLNQIWHSTKNKWIIFFICFLGKMMLTLTDNFNKTLQNLTVSATQGQDLAHAFVEMLLKDRYH